MIGVIPGSTQTFEVMGDFSTPNPVEGKLYYNSRTGRLFFYSLYHTRSSPDTGFFPVWDGKKTYISNFSNEKFIDKDVTMMDINTLSSSITSDKANQVKYLQRKADNDKILEPVMADGDNWFTQCIKGSIAAKKLTIIDLVDMSVPPLPQGVIENYYAALLKIAFMRTDKWQIWIDNILHLSYKLDVFKDDRQLVSYEYPSGKFDTGSADCKDIIDKNMDPLKKIVKLVMKIENITKSNLRSDDIDDYTINNMMTTLNGTKALSAQLFSRFIRMAGLSFQVEMLEDGKIIFEYHE